ncbi:unnamed protein product, partial [Didymodactylos carnosus]
KKAVTFQLVHRSQHDPLISDDTAGEHVLVPLSGDKTIQRKVEQKKFGIDFDDEYDYMQHLRDPCAPPERYAVEIDHTADNQDDTESIKASVHDEAVSKLNLPSTVFESEVENDIGMLNLAAPDSGPKVHWDPDIIAALDDETFDYEIDENALDDDFMMQANCIEPLAEEDYEEFEDEIPDALDTNPFHMVPKFIPKTNKPIPLALRRFLDVEDGEEEDGTTKMKRKHKNSEEDGGSTCSDDQKTSQTKYTNYSMTSSVIRRNNGLQLIDEQFDKIFDEYGDDDIGPLDAESIGEDGIEQNDDLVKQTVRQFEDEQEKSDAQIEKIAIEKTKKLLSKLEQEQDQPNEKDEIFLVDNNFDKDKEKWDCETILSTYSNLYNHPRLIQQIPNRKQKIRLSQKTGLPLIEKDEQQSNSESDESEDDDQESAMSKVSDLSSIYQRKKNETSEERRARKQAVKDIRRDRRQIKKATKLVFKQEEQKQLQQLQTTQQHLQSLRVT